LFDIYWGNLSQISALKHHFPTSNVSLVYQ
jgi:hypothetical protein